MAVPSPHDRAVDGTLNTTNQPINLNMYLNINTIQAYKRICISTVMHIYLHIQTCIHTCMHTCTRPYTHVSAYMHKYMQTRICILK